MNILIYGGGSVGLGIASCFLKSGQKIGIVGRKDTVSALKKSGLKRTGLFGNFHASPETFGSYSSLGDIQPTIYDYILVCTKSYDSCSAAKDISSYPVLFNDETKIILFQNGWGNAEVFRSFFPREQIYNARVITGFCRPEKNHVDITVHADSIHIGSLFRNNVSYLETLCALIDKGGVPCEVTVEIEKDLWAKMLYNCTLNPLGAILRAPYGVLGKAESTRNIMEGIAEEVFLVMQGAGYVTHWASVDDYLKTFYEKLLPPTAKHESSMLQDIQARKKTEIEALNGAIVHLGEKLHIETPHNMVVCGIVKFMEEKNSLVGEN
jgi:2-dehydropantoate 2-reductase